MRTSAVTFRFPPDQANSGMSSIGAMSMSWVRAERTGPTTSGTDDW